MVENKIVGADSISTRARSRRRRPPRAHIECAHTGFFERSAATRSTIFLIYYFLFIICSQNLPLLRNEQFLKQARGELVAHAADVVGHGTVHTLIVGDLHVKVRHQGRFVAQAGVQLADELVHLLFLALGLLVDVDRRVHEVLQHGVGGLDLEEKN